MIIKLFYLLFTLISFSYSFTFNNKNIEQQTAKIAFHSPKKLKISDKIFFSNKEINIKNFKKYTIENVVFRNITFKKTRFTNTKIINCKFINCKFYAVDFRNSVIKSSLFKKCEIKSSFFEYSHIFTTLFLLNKFQDSSFLCSQLINSKFTESLLTGSSWINGEKCKKGSIGKCILKAKRASIIKK